MEKQAIVISDVQFSRDHFTLGPVSLSIPEGYITAIVGPNGSGKSTLFHMLMNQIKPQSGTISVLDRQVGEENDDEFALYLLDKFKRKYATILSTDDLKRERIFVDILEKMLKKNTVVKNESYVSKVQQFVSMRAYVPGDFEYISMSAWLNSKISADSYYKCLLQLVRA